MEFLEQLIQDGNIVLIIEGELDILAYWNYIIELGPEGGPKKGKIIALGTPEEIIANMNSVTEST